MLVVLPIGFGKSLIFQLLVKINEIMSSRKYNRQSDRRGLEHWLNLPPNR